MGELYRELYNGNLGQDYFVWESGGERGQEKQMQRGRFYSLGVLREENTGILCNG